MPVNKRSLRHRLGPYAERKVVEDRVIGGTSSTPEPNRTRTPRSRLVSGKDAGMLNQSTRVYGDRYRH